MPDKKVVLVRLRDYELAELDACRQILRVPSRNTIVNIALRRFLRASPKAEFHAKRVVKLRIDGRLQKKLAEMAERLGATCTEIIRMAVRDLMENKPLPSAGDRPSRLPRDHEREEFSNMKTQLINALKDMESHDSVFDFRLVEEIASSAIYVRRGEQYLDNPDCTPETYAAVSDAMAKHAARMRAAIKDLAANRAERLKVKSASSLAAEIQKVIDRVVREE